MRRCWNFLVILVVVKTRAHELAHLTVLDTMTKVKFGDYSSLGEDAFRIASALRDAIADLSVSRDPA
jgi:hypothetical protein